MGKDTEVPPDDERPTVRIPKYRRNGDVVAWSDVDAIWLAQVRYTEEIKNQVVETYLHKPGVESIERGLGPKTIGGFSMETIHVLVSDEASADALELPE